VITIREVMNNKVVAVGPEWTVEETIDFLTQHHIGGSPVVNAEGRLVGMISELALIDVVFDHNLKDVPISKYMNTELHVIRPDESLARAAQLFALYSFRRLPIVENGKLVGIISRRDLMNYSLRSNHALEDPLVALIPELATLTNCEAAASIS
jgi:tRNA nucleotidyltransferase (CCA-adding enzyme)